MFTSKSKTIERQFTISSSISSINMASRQSKQKKSSVSKPVKKVDIAKTPLYDTRQGLKKFQSSPYLKYIERFEKLALSPGALPHIRNRILSPISRAERVLKKTHKRNMKSDIKLDSSIEASLEKMGDDNYVFDKNDKFMTIFTSSKSSDKNDNDEFLKTDIRFNKKVAPKSPSRPLEHESHSNLKTNTESRKNTKSVSKHRSGVIKANKKIFDTFYKNLEFKPEHYGLNVYCPGMSASNFKNFFTARLTNQQVRIKPNKEYFLKTSRSPFRKTQKFKELMMISSVNKSLAKTSYKPHSRNHAKPGLPYIKSAVNLIKIEANSTVSQTGATHKSHYSTVGAKHEQSGSMSPDIESETKFRSQSKKLSIQIPQRGYK
jgi:hypothetical protein